MNSRPATSRPATSNQQPATSHQPTNRLDEQQTSNQPTSRLKDNSTTIQGIPIANMYNANFCCNWFEKNKRVSIFAET